MAFEKATPSVNVNLKAILLLVIAAGLALAALFHRHKTENATILTIARRPLKPLTPPLTVDKRAILSELQEHRFDVLDRQLKSYQQRADTNVVEEANAHMAYETFDNLDPQLVSAMDQWVKISPSSYSAHLARAYYLFHEGSLARGDKWASQTSDQQFAHMRKYFMQGGNEAETALRLEPKLVDGYLLLENPAANEGPRSCLLVAQAGLKQVPGSFLIRALLMNCFEPRWGGSYKLMDWVAKESRPFEHANPRLHALNGFADADRANWMNIRHNYVAAVELYTRAIDEGGDFAGFYRGRAKAFCYLQRYADALEDLRRADQLWPQDPDTLELMAWALAQIGQQGRALDSIDLAARIGGPDSDIQQLRGQLLAGFRKGKTVKAGTGD